MINGYKAIPGLCLHCVSTLKPVGNSNMPKDHNQYTDAMNLIFVPGYGELIDGDQAVNFVLCELCAKRLFELFPEFEDKLIHYSDSSLSRPPSEIKKLRLE